jgi:hypothetical protein
LIEFPFIDGRRLSGEIAETAGCGALLTLGPGGI